jgi:hypothetical protein
MATAENVVEIEIDGEQNENCVFRPLRKRLRGRFDLRRVAEPQAGLKAKQHPQPIPGQRLRLNIDTKRLEIIESLRLPESTAIRERYERGPHGELMCRLPEHETIDNVDVPTILYWMQAEVNNKTARLVGAGRFPANMPGKVQRSFYSPEREKRDDAMASGMKAMADAVTANTRVMEALLAKLTK